MAYDLVNDKKESSLVTVIMAAYNSGAFISDAIRSVLDQTHVNWELIVIDDGSSDNTGAIVKEFMAWDGRIRYIYKENGGQGSARNRGIKSSVGKYIAFLDADDLWLPDKLQVQLSLLSEKGADLVFSDAYMFEDKPGMEKKLSIATGFYKGEEAIHSFLMFNHVPTLTVLAHRSAIQNAGGFSERKDIHEDWHLWTRMLIAGCSFFGWDRPLAHYRVRTDSTTSDSERMTINGINVLQDLKALYPKYSGVIDQSVRVLINTHLTKVNVSSWKMARRLLEIHNSVSADSLSLTSWKRIYMIFGKDIFRILFNLKMKKKIRQDDIRPLKASIV